MSRLGLELGPHVRPLAGRVEAVDQRRGGRGPCRRPARLATAVGAIAARAASPASLVRDDREVLAGSTRSMPWWGTSARSAGVGLAVPMSMPRYTCIESTTTSSVPASLRARRRASADLPAPVGPTMATGRGAAGPETLTAARAGSRPVGASASHHRDAGAVGGLGHDLDAARRGGGAGAAAVISTVA